MIFRIPNNLYSVYAVLSTLKQFKNSSAGVLMIPFEGHLRFVHPVQDNACPYIMRYVFRTLMQRII